MMSTLATQLFSKDDASVEDERLLSLFQNRVELKKEFAKLRGELERLADQLNQQESATLKAQQKLEQLEGLLTDPECAANAIVFYQLRGVWQHCRRRLRGFAAELSTARKEAEYKRLSASFEQRRTATLTELEGRLEEIVVKKNQLAEKIKSVEASRKGRRGFWNFFRRRELKARLEELYTLDSALDSRQAEIEEAREACTNESPPTFPGISAEGNRSINLAVISLAQELFLHFFENEISNLSREASIRLVGDVQYGNRRDCREMSSAIDGRIKELDADAAGLAARVQARANYLKGMVEYRRDTDTVPVASILATTPKKLENNSPVGELSVNILAEEFWDIFAILLT